MPAGAIFISCTHGNLKILAQDLEGIDVLNLQNFFDQKVHISNQLKIYDLLQNKAQILEGRAMKVSHIILKVQYSKLNNLVCEG